MKKILAYFWAPSGVQGVKHHLKDILISYSIMIVLTLVEMFTFRELYILLVILIVLQFGAGFVARRVFGDTVPDGSRYEN